jgi:hypothetical protein
MNSIFDKKKKSVFPTTVTGYAEGGEVDTKRWEAAKRAYIQQAYAEAKKRGVDVTEILSGKGLDWATPPLATTMEKSAPVFTDSTGKAVRWRDVATAVQQEPPEALSRFAEGAPPPTPNAPSNQPAPLAPPSTNLFDRVRPPLAGAANAPTIDLSGAFTVGTQEPIIDRAARIKKAQEDGSFDAIRTQFNRESLAARAPQQMDEQGNIVQRQLGPEENAMNLARLTGGNTALNSGLPRAVEMAIMDKARRDLAVSQGRQNVAELKSAQESGIFEPAPVTQEVAPGVRGAFRNGEMVGFSSPATGAPATMNDPLKKYITNPDGSVSLNPNPPQLDMAQWTAGQNAIQGTKGLTGGTALERGFQAAIEAANKKKKTASQ